MTTDRKKSPGRPPLYDKHMVPVQLYVTPDQRDWLRSQPNASQLIRQMIDERKNEMNTSDFEAIDGLSFFSTSQLKREMHISSKTASTISKQPGYRSGEEMAVAKAKSGGWRLYVRVDNSWMDASLHDM